jgi:hypothetical protein
VRESNSGNHQVLSDGRTVWVNEGAGGAVARLSSFGSVAMVDVHRPLAQQCTDGECLDCRHDLARRSRVGVLRAFSEAALRREDCAIASPAMGHR